MLEKNEKLNSKMHDNLFMDLTLKARSCMHSQSYLAVFIYTLNCQKN